MKNTSNKPSEPVKIMVEQVGALFVATAMDDLGAIARASGRNKHAAIERVKTKAIIELEDQWLEPGPGFVVNDLTESESPPAAQ